MDPLPESDGCQLDPTAFPKDLGPIDWNEFGFMPELPIWTPPYSEPSFSSDGRWVVFRRQKVLEFDRRGGSSIDVDSTGLWIMRSDGRDMRLLMAGFDLYSPAVSPDGNWLAFVRDAQIYKIRLQNNRVDPRTLSQLTTDGRNFTPAWSPDGEMIAYGRSSCTGPHTCGIRIVTIIGRDDIHISDAFGHPSWYPNGEILLGMRNSSPGIGGADLVVRHHLADPDRIDTIRIPVGVDNRQPRYAPDGSRLVFQSQSGLEPGELWRASSVTPHVWMIREDGSNAEQLTDFGGRDPVWSPDGRRILYVHHNYWVLHPHNGTLWTMNPDGSGKRQLTFNHGVCIDEVRPPTS